MKKQWKKSILEYPMTREKNKPAAFKLEPFKATGDLFADDCFSFDLAQEVEMREANQIEGLKEVPGLVKSEQFEPAWSILQASHAAYTDFDFIYVWQAVILQRNGQAEKAAAVLTTGLENSKRKHVLCERFGHLSYETGDTGQAVKWWIRSIVLMLISGTSDMWEPFLYLAYIADTCGRKKASQHLKAQVAEISVQGELALEKDAENKLIESAGHLPVNSVALSIDILFGRFNKKLAPLPRKSPAPQAKKPAQADEKIQSPEIQPPEIQTWKSHKPRMLAAAGLFGLIGLGLLFYLFFGSSQTPQTPVGIEPAPPIAPAPQKPAVKNSSSTTDQPTQKTVSAPAALSTEGARAKKVLEPPVPNKSKQPGLLVKTKTIHPEIKKKTGQPADLQDTP